MRLQSSGSLGPCSIIRACRLGAHDAHAWVERSERDRHPSNHAAPPHRDNHDVQGRCKLHPATTNTGHHDTFKFSRACNAQPRSDLGMRCSGSTTLGSTWDKGAAAACCSRLREQL